MKKFPNFIDFQKVLEYINTADAADFEFEFQAYVNYDGMGDDYELYQGHYKLFEDMQAYTNGNFTDKTTEADGVIKLRDGQIAQLDDDQILANSTFYLVEKGALSDKYDFEVENTMITTITDQETGQIIGVKTGELNVEDEPFVVFSNKVRADNKFNLQIKKTMIDQSTPDDVFYMKLLLGTSVLSQ